MRSMTSFRGLAYLSYLPFAVVVNAAIGPVADLHITNENMAPDGFNRTVVVAGGTMPGPLIKGNIVRHYFKSDVLRTHACPGRQIPNQCT